MRVLCIPQVTTWKLETESDFTDHLAIMRAVQEVEPSHGYMWVRARDQESHWPGITLFAEEATPNSFYALQTSVTGRLFELFNRISGPFPVDMVVTSRAGLAPSLAVGLQAKPYETVPVVIAEPRVYAPGAIAHQYVDEIAAAARAVGYATALNVFWSEWEMNAALQCVEMWMSPAAIQRARERSTIIRLSVETPTRLAPRSASRKRLLFAGRLNTNKRWMAVLDSFRKVMQSRQDTEVWLHSGTGALNKVNEKLGSPNWLRVSERFESRAEWLKLLDSSHVAAYASIDEGENLTVLEMLARGVVLALPATAWVDRLLYPHTYPYKFQRLAELPELCDWLLDHHAEARKRLEPIREMIAERHDSKHWVDGWRTIVDRVRLVNDDEPALYEIRNDVRSLLESEDELTMYRMLELSRMGSDHRPWKRQVFSNYDGWRAVRDWDDHLDANPNFTRELRDQTA